MLDVDGDGFISRFELKYFYNYLAPDYDDYLVLGGAMPTFDDFANQLFDMVGPNLNGRQVSAH